ncbi:hypothetical protein [Fulvimonas soli]|uniref:Uncharacterized protein n=1 Tax=Fulvimonas soli TaxID=155197 RepID=A0A316I8B5_9GAMM|nr:hypothetical protein [Fulvimonas soli]PWK86638.1 hypothetical protein C7456_10728 [Fulvimonas soli]TNY26341.1 hypothetical protein BV497_09390 [Fulvimonas soli]
MTKLKLLCSLLVACGAVAAAHAAEPASIEDLLNPMLYPKDARPFDKGIASWAELSWQWIYAQPLAHNPYIDPTGADCAVGQDGPVWFLAPIAAPGSGVYTRSCTIPRGKAILLNVGSIADDWPCPDPAFAPGPGQSLYDFLVADALAYNMVVQLDLKLDGRPVFNPKRYLYTSEDLFALKGDLSETAFDPCITGGYQPGIVYGYFLMFRPMAPGMHTIVRHNRDSNGTDLTFVYRLTIQ